jgi:hypothetical protein
MLLDEKAAQRPGVRRAPPTMQSYPIPPVQWKSVEYASVREVVRLSAQKSVESESASSLEHPLMTTIRGRTPLLGRLRYVEKSLLFFGCRPAAYRAIQKHPTLHVRRHRKPLGFGHEIAVRTNRLCCIDSVVRLGLLCQQYRRNLLRSQLPNVTSPPQPKKQLLDRVCNVIPILPGTRLLARRASVARRAAHAMTEGERLHLSTNK